MELNYFGANAQFFQFRFRGYWQVAHKWRFMLHLSVSSVPKPGKKVHLTQSNSIPPVKNPSTDSSQLILSQTIEISQSLGWNWWPSISFLYLFPSSNSFSIDNDVALRRMHLQLLSSPTQFFGKFCPETHVCFKEKKIIKTQADMNKHTSMYLPKFQARNLP